MINISFKIGELEHQEIQESRRRLNVKNKSEFYRALLMAGLKHYS